MYVVYCLRCSQKCTLLKEDVYSNKPQSLASMTAMMNEQGSGRSVGRHCSREAKKKPWGFFSFLFLNDV